MKDTVFLDENIRTFVVIPIFIMVCLLSVLRGNLLGGANAAAKAKPDEARNTHHVTRSKLLAANGKWLSSAAYSVRHAFYNKKGEGFFHKAPAADAPDPLAAMANQDIGSTSNMMMSQFGNMALSMGFFYIINEFFPGFVVAKTPFPLTFKFKFMLQSGVNLPALDVKYISSNSWYTLCMMACGSLLQLIYAYFAPNSSADFNSAEMLQAQMGMPAPGAMNPMGGGQDVAKMYKGAFQALELNNHSEKVKLGLKKAPKDLLTLWKGQH